ncbi:MAG: DUF2007 domain-containing protein [Planctomycetota bacterium]
MPDSRYVVVHTAPGFHLARILAGLLEAEGITARVPGSELTDEFGSAMRMAGTADVIVMERDVERARDIVAAWQEAPDEGATDGGPVGGSVGGADN